MTPATQRPSIFDVDASFVMFVAAVARALTL